MNSEIQRFILYFSKMCPHSTKFRQMLVKKPDVEAKFVQLCVDTLPREKLPRYVDSVPYIVVFDEKGRPINLGPNAAFAWLKEQLEQHAGDFEAYDSAVMGSTLSDTFAFICEDKEASSGAAHTFEWLPGHRAERGSTMQTPNELSYGGGSNRQPAQPDNVLEKLIQQRNRDLPTINNQKPAEIDFSKSLSQPQQRQYTEATRKQEVRIAPQRKGIDFADPNFRAGAQQRGRGGTVGGTGLRPIAGVRNNGPVGRRLPQNIPK